MTILRPPVKSQSIPVSPSSRMPQTVAGSHEKSASSSWSASKAKDANLSDTTHDRLSELAHRFQSFERQVEADTKARKQTEDSTVEGLFMGVQRLEECIAQEAQARARGLQELQASLEPKLAEAQGKLEAAFLNQFEHVHALIDAVNDRTAAVEKDFVQSRTRYVGEMEMESSSVDAELVEIAKAFDLEVQVRKERERNLEMALERAESQTAEKLARDEQLSERKYAQLLRDADESVRSRDRTHQSFKEQAQEELSSIKGALAEATKVRSQADDDIVAALNHYTKELQKALSSVSQGALEAALRS